MEIDFPLKRLKLSEEQYKIVVSSPKENQRILAAAGSGKTTTITARIAWLIIHYKVPPARILLATFSRTAANEMLHRVQSLIGADLASQLLCGTFHALAQQVLRKYAPSSVRDLYFVDELPIRWQQWLKGTAAGSEWVSRLRYVIVDEFQDINEQQSDLIDLLRHGRAYTTVVGDDAQNIYTWRGSNTEFILNFHKRFSGEKFADYQLRNNYRSSEAIIAVANSVMRYIPTLPFKEKMIAVRKGGIKPNVHFFYRGSDEAIWVGKMIHEIRSKQPTATIAILSRYNTDLYRVEESLLKQGIPTTLLSEDVVHTENVVLSTFHSSKGLEWDVVFCMNLNDDVFPSRKKSEVLGERRLFYVAITRARTILYLSYSNKEQALSRFVREVSKGLLIYNGIAKYALSSEDAVSQIPTVRDLVGLMDGADFIAFRGDGLLPSWTVQTDQVASLGEGWKVPDCVVKAEAIRYFDGFMKLWARYTICSAKNQRFRDPTIQRLLFTLRVYGEDRAFWEQWETEITELVRTYFKFDDGTNIKHVEYTDLLTWIKDHDLPWKQDEIVAAMSLLGKIRGQLVPMRFVEYNIEDYVIGTAKSAIPTEWRPIIMESWRQCSAGSASIQDLWRLAACYEVAEGRNAVLYRCDSVGKELLESEEFLEFLALKRKEIYSWIRSDVVALAVEVSAEEGIKTPVGELIVGDCLWNIETGIKHPGLDIWLEWALIGSLARRSGFPIRRVGVWHPLQGVRLSIELDGDSWDLCAQTILDRLLCRFVNRV